MQRSDTLPTPENVKKLLNDQLLPILPIEEGLIQNQFAGLTERQKELGKLLGEAMSQTSETWHDNAPADAINLEGARNSNTAERVIDTMNRAVVLPYTEDTQRVTLGSSIFASIAGRKDRQMVLVGFSQEINEHLRDGVIPFTLKSPLGEAILGAEKGQEIEYKVGNRTLHLAVHGIELPQESFTLDLATA